MTHQSDVDVVLIDTGFDGNQRFLREERSQPHLGLAYIAAFLEKHSYRIKILDRIVNPLSPKEVAKIAIDYNPEVVGITTSTIDRFLAIKILHELKLLSKKILTVGGGPHFSSTATDALEQITSLDIICVGEGEYTLCEIVERYRKTKNKNDFESINGIVYRNSKGKIIKNKERSLINDIDSLPFPALHLFDIDKYIGKLATAPNAPYRAIGVGSSRGCPYSCAFCYNSLSKKVRNLSVSRFIDLIEFLFYEYKFDAFNFVDDSFACNPNRVIAICNEIIKRKLDIKWYCSINVNQAAQNIKMLKIMKNAGCMALGFGVEFPENSVLKAINKKSTTAMIKKAIYNVKNVDFPFVHIFLLQGLPYQTIMKTIYANLRTIHYRIILKDRKNYFGGFVQVYPGTQLESLSMAQGKIDEHFSWNSPYISSIAANYKNSPNQHNKLPTLPLYKPTTISLNTILIINKSMSYVAKVILFFNYFIERMLERKIR